jgi:hypothetical protein
MLLVLMAISFSESDQVDEVATVIVSAALRLDDDAMMTFMTMTTIVILHLLVAVAVAPSEPQS